MLIVQGARKNAKQENASEEIEDKGYVARLQRNIATLIGNAIMRFE
jgi:hypothetical protein